MALPTTQNIQAANSIYQRLVGWKSINGVISRYFLGQPGNSEKDIVFIKVVLVDALYNTNLQKPLQMASHIIDLHGLDELFRRDDIVAVEGIATADRYYCSFASKYTHFHCKSAFPIYDSFVDSAISLLQGHRIKPGYEAFFQDIQSFRSRSRLDDVSWEDFDKFLWLYGQKKALDKKKKEVGNEVKALYETNKGRHLFEALET